MWRPASAQEPRFLSLESDPFRECTFKPELTTRSQNIVAAQAKRGKMKPAFISRYYSDLEQR